MAILTNGPGVHLLGNVPERRDLTHLVQVLAGGSPGSPAVGHYLWCGRRLVPDAGRLDAGMGFRVHSHDNLLVDGKASPSHRALRICCTAETCASLGLRSSEISTYPRLLNAAKLLIVTAGTAKPLAEAGRGRPAKQAAKCIGRPS